MESKTLQDAFVHPKELAAHLEMRLGHLLSPARPEATLANHDARLARARERLESTTRDRDEIVRRWDERVERWRAEVDRLTGELQAAERHHADPQTGPRPRKTAPRKAKK